jgi:DNA helicase HerA-like ATPase
VKSFILNAENECSGLSPLIEFLKEEERNEKAEAYSKLRFVGYVLDITFDSATIITSDPYKKAVGGIPRGSFLIMTPTNFSEDVPPHFTLLRVAGATATPLAKEIEQTYFELHKKSMPELDIWTKGELQWGALKTNVLGMFYPTMEDSQKISFSGDVNTIVSAHKYKVFSPTEDLLNLIINKIVPEEGQHQIGQLRFTECQLPFASAPKLNVPVMLSTKDFRGTRTALFGKTRLGKSNVVKIIAESMIEDKNIGQIIFDINGEYANSQNQNMGFKEAYPSHVDVYALKERKGTLSKPLSLNFYEQPKECIQILGTMLDQDNFNSIYVKAFGSTELASLDDISSLEAKEKTRPYRKIQMYWSILKTAGFTVDEGRLKKKASQTGNFKGFDPGFSEKVRETVYGKGKVPADKIDSLDKLTSELIKFAKALQEGTELKSSSSPGKDLFDADDKALLNFLSPKSGSGPTMLQSYRIYHSPKADDFVEEILKILDDGGNVILDLGSANEKVVRYFSDMLCKAIFREQEKKFTENRLDKNFIQLYFEEAHNLFPVNDKEFTGIYTRFAKEGAKFHIGMVYSTQSPSTISKELLVQTENFFVAHLSAESEVHALSKLQISFSGIEQDILRAKTPGYLRMLTMSNRFVVPFQAKLFSPVKK